MNIKIGAFMACTLVVGSFSAFAQAPVPYNVRAGHNIIYMDWSANALSTVSALESASFFPKISSSHLKSITSSLDFHYDHSRTC